MLNGLSINCEACTGLCCVALYFAQSEGFPADKAAGEPCRNLTPDFRCAIHPELAARKRKGCMAYDCFGAGQKVAQAIYPGQDWRASPDLARQMFDVFMIVFQIHQMLWYLAEAWDIPSAEGLKPGIHELICENERMTRVAPAEILALDIGGYRLRVNKILKAASGPLLSGKGSGKGGKAGYIGKNFKRASLDGNDLSMALLIAANLEGCSLRATSFLGADLRDANICDTDLSGSIFLTQGQINAAKGNSGTKLPAYLSRPAAWRTGF